MTEPTPGQMRAWAARKLEQVSEEARRVDEERRPGRRPSATMAGPAGSDPAEGFTAVRCHADGFVAVGVSAAGFRVVAVDDLDALVVGATSLDHAERYAFSTAGDDPLTLVVPGFAAHVGAGLRAWVADLVARQGSTGGTTP